jgi:hypothetical protein
MSNDTQETNTVDEHAAQRVETAVSYILEGLRARSATPLEAAAMIAAAEVRRLREVIAALQDEVHNADNHRSCANKVTLVEADRDQLSASNLRLVAERDQLKAELAAAHMDAAAARMSLAEFRDDHAELQAMYNGLCK